MKFFFFLLFIIMAGISGCLNKEDCGQKILFERQNKSNILIISAVGDTLDLFQDTIFSMQAIPAPDSVIQSKLIAIQSIPALGLKLLKHTSGNFYNKYHTYFFAFNESGAEKIYCTGVGDKNYHFSIDSIRLEYLLLPFYTDSVLLVHYIASDHNWSPYFASDLEMKGIQIWDIKRKLMLLSVFPYSENYTFIDIVKGDYDEEVGGSPVIGTQTEERKWAYRISYNKTGLYFDLFENEHYYDSDLYSIDSSMEEERDTFRITDTSRVVYRLVKQPIPCPDKK